MLEKPAAELRGALHRDHGEAGVKTQKIPMFPEAGIKRNDLPIRGKAIFGHRDVAIEKCQVVLQMTMEGLSKR